MKQVDRTAAGFTDSAVPFAEFDFDAVDRALASADEDAIRRHAAEIDRLKLRQEVTVRLLQWLASGNPSLAEIGRRVLTMNHLILANGKHRGEQKKLAARCGITEAALSMRISKLRYYLSEDRHRN